MLLDYIEYCEVDWSHDGLFNSLHSEHILEGAFSNFWFSRGEV